MSTQQKTINIKPELAEYMGKHVPGRTWHDKVAAAVEAFKSLPKETQDQMVVRVLSGKDKAA